MISLEEFGLALGFLRQRSGLRQRDVERKVGMPPKTQSQYENGRQGPGFQRLVRILDVLDASFADLHQALSVARGEATAAARPPEPPLAPEDPPSVNVDKDASDRPPRLPAGFVGREVYRVIATMVQETVAEDPEGVIAAIQAAEKDATAAREDD